MLLIGSKALQFHINPNRKCKDFDFICTHDELQKVIELNNSLIRNVYPINKGKTIIIKTTNNEIYEFEIAWEDSTSKKLLELIDGYGTWHTLLPIGKVLVPSLDILYTIKMSHRYLKNSPHFLKTMKDIHLMRNHGATIPNKYKEWLKERENETYTYEHPKLNMKKSDFFNSDQGISYIYDHDSIHEAVKHLDKPAYLFFKKENEEIMCDKEKFFNLPFEIKLYSVLEESYVLALERSQIPFVGKIDPKLSFLMALEKVCTSISSGWWREFAYDYYFNVVSLYNENYVDKFWKSVNNGIVKKYQR